MQHGVYCIESVAQEKILALLFLRDIVKKPT